MFLNVWKALTDPVYSPFTEMAQRCSCCFLVCLEPTNIIVLCQSCLCSRHSSTQLCPGRPVSLITTRVLKPARSCFQPIEEVDSVIRGERWSQLFVVWTKTLQEPRQRKVRIHTRTHTHRKQAGRQHVVICWQLTKKPGKQYDACGHTSPCFEL